MDVAWRPAKRQIGFVEALATSQDRGDQARADLANPIDLQMAPLGLPAMDALAPAVGWTALDVGCGAGATSVQFADRVGPTGRVIGVDIAPRVMAVARHRTSHLPQITLLQEDAARLKLPDRSVDGIFSRFGTMFFAEPVAAFANLRRMLRYGGRIAFVCWRSARENELDFLCVEAAGLPFEVNASPFSFADGDTIHAVLRSAGFHRIEVMACDASVSCGDVEATLKVVTRVGALGAILRERPALVAETEPRVRAALLSRQRDGTVNLGTATWVVTATTT